MAWLVGKLAAMAQNLGAMEIPKTGAFIFKSPNQ